MIQKILVPLDGSSAAEIVLPCAEEIATKSASSIILIMATGLNRQDLEPLYSSYLEQIRKKLQARLVSHRASQATKLVCRVLKGAPADEILSYADEVNADLIVMASRGSTRHGPWLLGSIATRITMACPKPVLVIKKPANKVAVEQGQIFKKILVPLDGSICGEAALPVAEALARTMSSELILINAVEPIETWVDYGAVYAGMPAPEDERAIPIAYLESLRDRLIGKGLTVKVVVQDGAPADVIVNYARTEDIDTIAISTHGESGITRWFFGSVTEKVLHHGESAVLVVHANKV